MLPLVISALRLRARKDMFLRQGPAMVHYLEAKGVPFHRCDGWADPWHSSSPSKPEIAEIPTLKMAHFSEGRSEEFLEEGYGT